MKMMNSRTVQILRPFMLVLLAAATGRLTIHADVISEDFNNGTLPPTLEAPVPGAVFVNGGVSFDFSPTRTYLRTVQSDFYNRNFVAEVTVTVSELTYFGMGQGIPNPGFFDEPAAPTINLRMHSSNVAGGRVEEGANVGDFKSPLNTFGNPGSGTHRLRLTWNAAARTAVFEVHQNYAGGPFVATFTSPAVNGADNGFTDSNTRIFFGSGVGASFFDDLKVTFSDILQQGALPQIQAVQNALGPIFNSTENKPDQNKLSEAAKALVKATDLASWNDPNHPTARKGDEVFAKTEEAAQKFEELQKHNHTPGLAGQLQPLIEQLVGAARLVATTAIADLTAQNPNSRDLPKAQEELVEGDADAAQGDDDHAIEEYKDSWKKANKG